MQRLYSHNNILGTSQKRQMYFIRMGECKGFDTYKRAKELLNVLKGGIDYEPLFQGVITKLP